MLEKERIKTETLRKIREQTDVKLTELSADFTKYKLDLQAMSKQHDQKMKEMQQIRIRTNEEIKLLSEELSKEQHEINMLILEVKKYESQIDFMSTEREIILQAQMQGQADKYTPEVQLITL